MSYDPSEQRDNRGRWTTSGADKKSQEAEKASGHAKSLERKATSMRRDTLENVSHIAAAQKAEEDAAKAHGEAAKAHMSVARSVKGPDATTSYQKAQYHSKMAEEHASGAETYKARVSGVRQNEGFSGESKAAFMSRAEKAKK